MSHEGNPISWEAKPNETFLDTLVYTTQRNFYSTQTDKQGAPYQLIDAVRDTIARTRLSPKKLFREIIENPPTFSPYMLPLIRAGYTNNDDYLPAINEGLILQRLAEESAYPDKEAEKAFWEEVNLRELQA